MTDDIDALPQRLDQLAAAWLGQSHQSANDGFTTASRMYRADAVTCADAAAALRSLRDEVTRQEQFVGNCIAVDRQWQELVNRAERAEAEVARLNAERESMIESDCDKVMAMTDEQVRALSVLQGSTADIDALKGKVAVVKAQLTVAERERNAAIADQALLRLDAKNALATADAAIAEADELRADAERVRATDLQLSRILHELAGAASMCWIPYPPPGEFDSTQACEFVANAIAEIRGLLFGDALAALEDAP